MNDSTLSNLVRAYKCNVAYQKDDRNTLYRVLIIQTLAQQTKKDAIAAMIRLGSVHANMARPTLVLMSEGYTLGEALLETGYIPKTDARAIVFAENNSDEVLVSTLKSLSDEKQTPMLASSVFIPFSFLTLICFGIIYGLSQAKSAVTSMSRSMPEIMDQPIVKVILFLDQYGGVLAICGALLFCAVVYFRSNAFGFYRVLLGPFNEEYKSLTSIRFCRLAQLTLPLNATTGELLDLAMDVVPGGYAKKGLRVAKQRLNNQESLANVLRGSILTEEHLLSFEAMAGRQTKEELVRSYMALEEMLVEQNTAYYRQLKAVVGMVIYSMLGVAMLLAITGLFGSVASMAGRM
ncbi:hypothetical protein N9L66_00355 [Porticoccaceae bacterium]|nr:hypothetical protein [Porticoccaceae bacterium]MDA8663397.1 hypothetical protein [Porticoccaceae bacterium]MDA8682036.1 hypothetical protein [Porticoccaceae bacterium]MDA8788771.1 hypothetical protein [Porticoccaceae bacterium]MDB2343052.1 hypothetical protein [Porticoccaceae bacterium]